MQDRFPDVRVRSWSKPGNPADRLVHVAADERVDTIVVGIVSWTGVMISGSGSGRKRNRHATCPSPERSPTPPDPGRWGSYSVPFASANSGANRWTHRYTVT